MKCYVDLHYIQEQTPIRPTSSNLIWRRYVLLLHIYKNISLINANRVRHSGAIVPHGIICRLSTCPNYAWIQPANYLGYVYNEHYRNGVAVSCSWAGSARIEIPLCSPSSSFLCWSLPSSDALWACGSCFASTLSRQPSCFSWQRHQRPRTYPIPWYRGNWC